MLAPMYGFHYIHKAIRHEMDALEALAGSSTGTGPQVTALAERLGFLREVVKIHAAGEDQVLYPALDRKVPQVSRSYALEHQYEESAFDEIESTLHGLQGAPAGAERSNLGRQLQRQVIALNATLSLHIWKEEEQLIPLLDQHYGLEEQAAMTDRIVKHIPPQIMQPLLPWELVALEADEQEDLLRTVMAVIPTEALGAVGAGLKANLPPADWAEIARRLPELAPA